MKNKNLNIQVVNGDHIENIMVSKIISVTKRTFGSNHYEMDDIYDGPIRHYTVIQYFTRSGIDEVHIKESDVSVDEIYKKIFKNAAPLKVTDAKITVNNQTKEVTQILFY